MLDQKYSGVVVSTSSRFYTVVKSGERKVGNVRVRSPQFIEAVWNYDVSIGEGETVQVVQSERYAFRNVFTVACVGENSDAERFVFFF